MVYFIQYPSGEIKIGKSVDPKTRIGWFQTTVPQPLKVLGLMEGSIKEEKMLHKKFKHINVRGEWFLPNEELLEFILSNKISETFFKSIMGVQYI